MSFSLIDLEFFLSDFELISIRPEKQNNNNNNRMMALGIVTGSRNCNNVCDFPPNPSVRAFT